MYQKDKDSVVSEEANDQEMDGEGNGFEAEESKCDISNLTLLEFLHTKVMVVLHCKKEIGVCMKRWRIHRN